MKKQITQKVAKEKYGVFISKMQHISHTKFYLLDNGNVVDSCGDIRFIADKGIDTADLCEVAHTITAEICKAKNIKLDKKPSVYAIDEETSYTEKAQNIFNRYFDLLDNTFRN